MDSDHMPDLPHEPKTFRQISEQLTQNLLPIPKANIMKYEVSLKRLGPHHAASDIARNDEADGVTMVRREFIAVHFVSEKNVRHGIHANLPFLSTMDHRKALWKPIHYPAHQKVEAYGSKTSMVIGGRRFPQ